MHEPWRGAFSEEAAWPAPAKLNLFLHVTGRRADGYHTLQTVFQLLDYGDSLGFELRDDGEIRRGHGPDWLAPEQDITLRAAGLLQQVAGVRMGVDIHLNKRIPSGGGLGGGSSNAATTLVALNQLWGIHWPLPKLVELGLKLGADVPVFVQGRSAWAEGVGDELSPIDLPEPFFLVVTPGCEVSTAEIFNAPELKRNSPPIRMRQFLSGMTHNDCWPVVRKRYPQVAQAFDFLAEHAEARLTGTGASVFAAFSTREAARAVASKVPAGWAHFVARGLNRSPLLERVGSSQDLRIGA